MYVVDAINFSSGSDALALTGKVGLDGCTVGNLYEQCLPEIG